MTETATETPPAAILDDAERALLSTLRELEIWPGEAMSMEPVRDPAMRRGFEAARLDAGFDTLRAKDYVRRLDEERVTVTKRGFLAGMAPV
jgi:CPA2 family monovalent cation:H+ antiporter-2